jgi:hypothetical protein
MPSGVRENAGIRPLTAVHKHCQHRGRAPAPSGTLLPGTTAKLRKHLRKNRGAEIGHAELAWAIEET